MKASFFDLVERAAWTFVQTFVAVLAVTPLDNAKTALAAATAAGLSAAKTFVKSTL